MNDYPLLRYFTRVVLLGGPGVSGSTSPVLTPAGSALVE